MTMSTKPIPDGFNTLSAHLVVPDCIKALDFYAKAFGAVQLARLAGIDGKSTMHAAMRLGNSTLMMTDENLQWGAKSPLTFGGSPVTLHLYVADADAAFAKAIEAGCTQTMPISDAFWGDRYGQVRDPFGHTWSIATHREDLSMEEIGVRAKAAMAAMAKH